ncbi:hypothetical protein D3P08_02770 [Paenibacillus nanensis]|uniref:Uncharacterized protein n=1 Tax=Paenibacillus nanensis TaxID=393251 RepID=A0A3A1VHT8_9BACL|nr:hypothetical protein D3P08_02770 [Paenibacillus nanensis]
MLVKLHPVSSFTTNIANMERYDRTYGHLYNATGYTDRMTGDELGVFYLKKKGPFWVVSSVGSGP